MMNGLVMTLLRAFCLMLVISWGTVGSSTVAFAQAAGQTTGSDAAAAAAGTAAATALQSKPGEFASGATRAAAQ
ncbi:hypothetical protein, partial [Salmonella enterica]|uniref:hypothetical protein n=1 Tax=Salmonella enterica TaxID=28901 RepID=UPI001BAFE0DA